MKRQILLTIALISLILSGCVIYSFYPLYTDDDLFENDLLTGNWEGDVIWKFEHPKSGEKEKLKEDKKSYFLTFSDEKEDPKELEFKVHIIKLGNQYFLDFIINDFYEKDNFSFTDYHLLPVHTIAKCEFIADTLKINWFSQDKLVKILKKDKSKIKYNARGIGYYLQQNRKNSKKWY